ncbi:arylsulfatase [Saccharopolyspora indica]|uniref:arylsulfatase n=1 Tax=Saccharopolyspora indica TaxID=1229659 RepID=UPI0022EAE7C6|nr:arylsulfatase [Saccharopolyspora indica]MDA3645131.1 arylsulfatase [Saccharopolyspora indica]
MSIPDDARGYEGFGGAVGRTFAGSKPWWPPKPGADRGAPNVVLIVVDDLGYSDTGPYGSEVDTPNLDRLAASGVQLTNYHTTPLCSPSRAALLTGLNPHRAGFAVPANSDPGFPSHAFELPDHAPTLAESLRAAGYATFAVGKWHLTRDALSHDAADRSSWPLQRGFDRYFGSLEGLTNMHHPHRLVWDNSPYDIGDQPADYFLTDDLTDRAIGMIDTLRANDADKPFFLYFAHHAVHGPIAAGEPDLAKYRGRYRAGWDAIREQRFDRQLAAGLFPEGTALPPRNSEPGRSVPPWDELSAEQQELYARYMEVYAAAVDSVDQSLGRLLDALARHGELDNTIIAFTSDNGATAEGGEEGTRSYFSQFAHVPGLPAEWERDVPRDPELIGGPQTTVHYPSGWAQASNTPFRLYKFDTFAGGVRTAFLLHWPAGLSTGGLRHQYVYVTDVAPTLLELAGVPGLTERHGVPAAELDGVSAVDVLRSPDLPSRHTRQYTETGGNRGYYADGWKIVTRHRRGTEFTDAEWELYHLDADPTETRDVAAENPAKLAELAAEWERAAWRNGVFPLNDGSPAAQLRRPDEERFQRPVSLFPGTPTLERYRSARLVQFRDFTATADLQHTADDRGVLFAHGDQGGGYLVHIDDGSAQLVYNAYGRIHRSDPVPVGTGAVAVQLVAEALPEFRWRLALQVGEKRAELAPVPQLLGMAPFTGISIGADRGGPVDWDLHSREGRFPYTGQLVKVRYEPGRQADYDPQLIARLWAEAQRFYE